MAMTINGAGALGKKRAIPINGNDHHDSDNEGRERRVRNSLQSRHQIVSEVAFGDMHAEQLGDLVQHNDECDPCLKANQDRFRNEISDEA
jgi:hypothetical protein